MKRFFSRISAAFAKAAAPALAALVAIFLVVILYRWAMLFAQPSLISHNSPTFMAHAFATLYFGTGAYVLRKQFLQMAEILRKLAVLEIRLPRFHSKSSKA